MKDSDLFTYIKNKKDWVTVEHDIKKVEYKVELIENNIYVLFQQSNEKTDWISNLNFPAKKYDGLLFHKGFCNQYDAIKKFVRKDLKDLVSMYPVADIFVAGWSLGAALAEIAAEDVYYWTGKRPTVISFGTPKACYNKETRDYIKSCCKEIREYCNKNDIVTYMPPIGYWHLNRIDIGDKFSLCKIIHPYTYHTNYDDVLREIGK